MGIIRSFLWYDLETFGLNASYDRIAQFAAQRTDVNLQPIEEPVVLYCRLSGDYIPDPAACIVTGITPQEVKKKGIPEYEFISKINEMMSVNGTCTVGFNSINFDDEFIRNTLYRNLMDPYQREYKNNCSRWDIIDLVRAVHDLRPEGICWPPVNPDTHNPVFKLTELTKANNISQIGAHDALVDVNATIAVAKLIKEKQGRLFKYYLSLRDKKEVKKILKIQGCPEMLLHVNATYTRPEGCTSLIMPICPSVEQDNAVWCFDLRADVNKLIEAEGDDVFMTPGLFKIAANKSPFISTPNTLKEEDFVRLGLNRNECQGKADLISENLIKLMMKLRAIKEKDFQVPDDPDFSIYEKFFSDRDKSLFDDIRNTPVSQILEKNENMKYEDARCKEMVRRFVCRNWPESLDAEQWEKWKAFCASRVLFPPGEPINNINFTRRKVAERLLDPELSDKHRKILIALAQYESALRKHLGIPEPPVKEKKS